jgi:hypothetical protein
MLPKYLKDSTLSSCFWSIIILFDIDTENCRSIYKPRTRFLVVNFDQNNE